MAYAWAGSQAVAETAAPLGARYNAWISSRKRSASDPLSRSNPGSDHNTANTTAYALDFATFNGAPLAHAIARHYGITNYRTGNYNFYYVRMGGATFRVQILWAVSGHFNHVHLGVRLVSGKFTGVKKKYPRTLRPGTAGPAVKRLKRRLTHHHYAGFSKASNQYGSDAVKAVKRFQREHNLKADGVVGPNTWAKLFR